MSLASEQRVQDTARIMDKDWEAVQKKTFTNWMNTKLKQGKYGPVEDVYNDLSSGVKLIELLDVIGGEPVGRYNKNPKLRLQKIENMNLALDYIKRKGGIMLTNIGSEDIVDSNKKLILGLLWMIILRFTIADISEEGLTAKEGLLLWCQRKCAPYSADFTITDFTSSWQSGLAFCALIHRHRPDLIDYWALNKSDKRGNVALALEVAANHVGIPKLLDVEDIVDVVRPDERSIMTYVAQYFHAFSQYDRFEQAGRRITRFGKEVQQTWEMENEYESRVRAFMEGVAEIQAMWASSGVFNGYREAKNSLLEFENYKNTVKRSWVTEKREIDTLLSNIQTKLKTYNMSPYYPPVGVTLDDLEAAWRAHLDSEGHRKRLIARYISEAKEELRKQYADAANNFISELNGVSQSLAQIQGDLEAQLEIVRELTLKLEPMSTSIQQIEELAQECAEAGIDDNEYTIYSIDDLLFDFGLLTQSLQKKAAFIENQLVLRNQAGLSPQQMEEYSSTFRHFDKDGNNTLNRLEFKACLQAAGIVYGDEEFEALFIEVAHGKEAVTFEEYIQYIQVIEEDRVTADQLLAAFKNLARDKPYITAEDMASGGIEPEVLEYFKQVMPQTSEGFDYLSYMNKVFV